MTSNNGKKTSIAKTEIITKESPFLPLSALPTADALKDRFKAGTIPLQSDFADLIDMANVGRTAVGDDGPGYGLSFDGQKRLQSDSKKEFYVSYDLSYCSSPAWEDYRPAIVIDKDYLGADVNHNHIALLAQNKRIGPVEAKQGSGESFTVFTVPAIATDASGNKRVIDLNIRGMKNNGINNMALPFERVDKNGQNSEDVSFNIDIQNREDYKDVNLSISPLILEIHHVTDADKDSIGEVIGIIKVSFNYSSAKQLIPNGLISMFSGSAVPEGWAICDGTNGTPDLRERFILGGDVKDVGGVTETRFSGDKNSKSFSFTSDAATIKYSGATDPARLQPNQIPNHQHLSGIRIDKGDFSEYGVAQPDKGDADTVSFIPGEFSNFVLYRTSGMENDDRNMGDCDEHVHGIEIDCGSHTHNAKLTVPYYILAFIMKL